MIPFISHDDLGAYLETVLDGSNLMTLIALDGACEAVRQELHRSLNLVPDDEIVMDGNGTAALMLPERPVHEVKTGTVQLDGAGVSDDDWELNKERGLLWLIDGTTWSFGHNNISLTYTHGYALGEDQVEGTIIRVPANIRLVALKLAAGIWRSKGSTAAAGAVNSEHIGSYSYTAEVDAATVQASMLLSDDDRRMLAGQRTAFAA